MCWLSLSQPTVEPVPQTDGKQSCHHIICLVIQQYNLFTVCIFLHHLVSYFVLSPRFFFCLNWIFVMLLVNYLFSFYASCVLGMQICKCKYCGNHRNRCVSARLELGQNGLTHVPCMQLMLIYDPKRSPYACPS